MNIKVAALTVSEKSNNTYVSSNSYLKNIYTEIIMAEHSHNFEKSHFQDFPYTSACHVMFDRNIN